MVERKTGAISVFVDESGSFEPDEASSRFYFICLVLHGQSDDISGEIERLNAGLRDAGVGEGHCVHAGPLIRREGEYREMLREERRAIFAKMLGFVRRTPISYRCFAFDKHFNEGEAAVHDAMLQAMIPFLVGLADKLNAYDSLRIYYDGGQSQVTHLLKEAFAMFSSKTEFVADVTPAKYRLFQAADMICAVELIDAKLRKGISLSRSEDTFFGGPRKFQRNILKQVRSKTI